MNFVGFDVKTGEVAAYNDYYKKTKNFVVTRILLNSQIESVVLAIGEIRREIYRIDCLCVLLDYTFTKKIRNQFIKSGKEYDIKSVQFIDKYTLNYIDHITRAKLKPEDDDIIWLFKTESLFRYCFIWKKSNGMAKMICRFQTYPDWEDYFKIKDEKCDGKSPKFIIYNKEEKVEQKIVDQAGSECKELILYKSGKKCEVAAIMARIIFSEFREFDAVYHLEEDMIFKINGKEIFSFNGPKPLPLEEAVTVPIAKDEKVLKVSAHTFLNTHYTNEIKVTSEMLKVGQIVFTFKINADGICDADYSIPEATIENIETRLKKLQFKKLGEVSYNIPKKFKTNNSKINAVGIDLGTSRCCVAVNRRNGIETVAIDSSQRQMPSYIGLDEETPKCGKEIIRRLQNYAKSIVFDSKRIIGRSYKDVKLDPSWPFEVIDVEDIPLIRVQGANGFVEKRAEEISGILLKHIKSVVEEFQQKELTEAVITVPAAFMENQQKATEVAGIFSGWMTVHLLPEPVAASIAYFIDREIPDKSTMLLFDLGGGTLDVCIFKIENNKLEIIGNTGDTNLGGRDFDQLLINHFENILKNDYGIDVNVKDKLKYRLMKKCMEIKHTLSVQSEASLDVNEFNANNEIFLKITRQEFETMAKDLLDRIKSVVIESLSASQLTICEINKVLYVGGGCYMPMIKLLLFNMFTKSEICCEENPDEVVAIGGAYYAYYLMLESQKSCSII